ncbi:MAG: helix-turn-helix transcriptional regulator [Myxococcota bacterium]|nr:helix-turn-helix transcriptional regulator [Myxococcota bacterium]
MLFGDWLKMLRQQRKLNQSALAARCGMTASYLSRVESGDRQPSPEHVHALARALGVDSVDAQLRAGIIPTHIMQAIQGDPQRLRRAFSMEDIDA